MTDRNLTPQEDVDWLEQQLAEAHALLGDTPKQPELPVLPEEVPEDIFADAHIPEDNAPEEDIPPSQRPREENRKPQKPSKAHKAPGRKDRVSTVLTYIIVFELLAIAGVAFYWVNMLT